MERKTKYMDMIQGIITRMASNQFLLKGWAVTLVAGLFALAAKEAKLLFFIIAYVPVVQFWLLDSYFLKLERKYRALYKDIASKNETEFDEKINYDLTPPKENTADGTRFFQCFFRPAEIFFYLPLALLVLVVILLSTRV